MIAILTKIESLEQLKKYTESLCYLGMAVCVIWLALLCRVTVEIWQAWKTIENYEKEYRSPESVKLRKLAKPNNIIIKILGSVPGTVSLNLIPVMYIIFYYLIIFYWSRG